MKSRSQLQFERNMRRSRGLSHPAAPVDGELWETRCEWSGCGKTFITATRQRKYCSASCRRHVEAVARKLADRLAGLMLTACAAPGCAELFLDERGQRLYCGQPCRQRASRAARDLSDYRCETCGTALERHRTKRARFCSATCRKRAARTRNTDTNTRRWEPTC